MFRRPPFTFPITILSTAVTGQDEYGNDVRESTETRARAYAVWPRVSDESTQGRNTVFVGINMVLTPDTKLRATDRVRWDGRVWEVEGEPGKHGPFPWTGEEVCVEVALTRVEG